MNTTYKQVTTATYNAIADEYVARDQSSLKETEVVRESLRHFVSLLPRQSTVLDVGSGGGRDSRYLASLGVEVTAIDISSELLKRAHALDTTGAIIYREMDLEDLQFPGASFDGVWLNASLHHIPKDHVPAVLQRVHHILKPNGYMAIRVYHGTGEGLQEQERFNQKIVRYFASYSPEELTELVERASFSVCNAAIVDEKWLSLLAQVAQK